MKNILEVMVNVQVMQKIQKHQNVQLKYVLIQQQKMKMDVKHIQQIVYIVHY